MRIAHKCMGLLTIHWRTSSLFSLVCQKSQSVGSAFLFSSMALLSIAIITRRKIMSKAKNKKKPDKKKPVNPISAEKQTRLAKRVKRVKKVKKGNPEVPATE